MSSQALLTDRVFRLSPAYELAPLHRLGNRFEFLRDDLSRQPDLYGVLHPRRSATLGVKTATRSLAALLRSVRTPAPLPTRLRRSRDPELTRELSKLVLDGVLEVEHHGRFVTGARAAQLVVTPSATPLEGKLVDLSREAVEYGAALRLSDPMVLSARMYFYNRAPVTPSWMHRVSGVSAAMKYLGIAPGEQLRAVLDADWNLTVGDGSPPWLHWMPRQRTDVRRDDLPVYKLYVSPRVEHLRDTTRVLVHSLTTTSFHAFKLGGDAHGMLRPDKIVVYFSEWSDLQRVASRLGPQLRGIEPQGVPFTCAMENTALLSWGMDPPRAEKILSWREAESWRLWISNRLAVYLLTAHATRSRRTRISAAEFAMERLRFDGVDVDTWAPTRVLWPAAERAVQ